MISHKILMKKHETLEEKDKQQSMKFAFFSPSVYFTANQLSKSFIFS